MIVGLLNALPLEYRGAVERTLLHLAGVLDARGVRTAFVPAADAGAVRHACDDADLVLVGDLRPGADLPVASALASSVVPVVLVEHGYPFCETGACACERCPVRPVCRSSDRMAIYRQLAESAALIAYLSPLHRQVCEEHWGRHDGRTILAPPSLGDPIAFRPSAKAPIRAVAFPGSTDHAERAHLAEFAAGRPDLELDVFGRIIAADPAIALPANLHWRAPVAPEARLEQLRDCDLFVQLPGRPVPFGVEAATSALAGREVVSNDRVGLLGWARDLRDVAALRESLDDGRRALVEAVASLLPGTRSRAQARPDRQDARARAFSMPLLWAHGLGLGDSINLLPFAQVLAAHAGPGALEWVMPDRHASLLDGEVDARVTPGTGFDVDLARQRHDIVFEVAISRERFWEGDVLDERWIRIELARQPNARQSVYENLLTLLARAGIPSFAPRPRLSRDPGREEALARRLEGAGIRPGRDLVIAIHPGAGARVKCWPAERFGALAKAWREGPGARVVLVGGVGEDDLVDRVLAVAPGIELTVRELPLRDIAALARLCTVWIGNDSGLTHLATASDVPVLAVFGPSSAHKWGPTSAVSRVVTAPTGIPGGRRFAGLEVDRVSNHLEVLLRTAAGEAPRVAGTTVVRTPGLATGPDGWIMPGGLEVRADGAGARRTIEDLLDACATPIPWETVVQRAGIEVAMFALDGGLVLPEWATVLGQGALQEGGGS